jgi:hypothetical protein
VGSSLGPKAAPALISISESSKHIVQIVQLLEERSMSFAFCLNKADTLVLCGMTLLYQSLDLTKESKVMKDNARLTNAVIKIVDKAEGPGSPDFKRIAAMLIQVDEPPRVPASLPTPPRQSPETCMPAPPRASPPTSHASRHKIPVSLGCHASASMSETDLLMQQDKLRKLAMPPSGQNRPELYKIRSRPSFDSIRPDPLPLARRDHRLSLSQAQAAQAAMIARVSPTPNTSTKQNLDYLSFNNTHSQPPSPVQSRSQQQQQHAQNLLYSQLAQKVSNSSTADWEALVGSLDGGQLNLYDAIYGGGLPASDTHGVSLNEAASWSPDAWDLSHFNLGDFQHGAPTAQSVLSLSEESLSSAEDLTASGEMGLSAASLDYHHNQPLLPVSTSRTSHDGFSLDGLEHFGL